MLRVMYDYEFDRIFSIMEASFPIDEYRPYDEQKALLSDERYVIYVLPDIKSGEVKAFITVWRLGEFAFVEHFAVNPEYRNQGLGAGILTELKDILDCRICLEVELPHTDFAIRRIGFYERNGFCINDYDYMQPPISKGRQEIPLRIMTTVGKLSSDEFEVIKNTIYREVYKSI